MKRDFLKDLGITDEETINKILNENSSDIGKAKTEVEGLQSELEKLKETHANTLAENTTLKQSLEDTKANATESSEKIAALEKELGAYQLSALKQKVAVESGIPIQLAERLTGTDEETLKTDAKTLGSYLAQKDNSIPLKDVEPKGLNDKDSAYKELLSSLNL